MKLTKRLIIFLIRKRLKIGKYEEFQFTNQKSSAVYFFTETQVIKYWHGVMEPSRVSLNWLLDDECEIVKVEEDDDMV